MEMLVAYGLGSNKGVEFKRLSAYSSPSLRQ